MRSGGEIDAARKESGEEKFLSASLLASGSSCVARSRKRLTHERQAACEVGAEPMCSAGQESWRYDRRGTVPVLSQKAAHPEALPVVLVGSQADEARSEGAVLHGRVPLAVVGDHKCEGAAEEQERPPVVEAVVCADGPARPPSVHPPEVLGDELNRPWDEPRGDASSWSRHRANLQYDSQFLCGIDAKQTDPAGLTPSRLHLVSYSCQELRTDCGGTLVSDEE